MKCFVQGEQANTYVSAYYIEKYGERNCGCFNCVLLVFCFCVLTNDNAKSLLSLIKFSFHHWELCESGTRVFLGNNYLNVFFGHFLSFLLFRNVSGRDVHKTVLDKIRTP